MGVVTLALVSFDFATGGVVSIFELALAAVWEFALDSEDCGSASLFSDFAVTGLFLKSVTYQPLPFN